MSHRSFLVLTASAFVGTVSIMAVGPSFVPDVTFTGSSLTGWHTVGNAEWRSENGEIVGKPTAPGGGWLVLDKPYQDVGVYVEYKYTSGCQTGVLFRETKDDSGTKGSYVDLSDPQIPTYSVTVAPDGAITSRDRARTGGGLVRFTAPPPPPNPNAPPRNFRPPQAGSVELPFSQPDTSLKPGDWNTA